MLVRKTMAQTVVTLVPVMWMAGCGSGFILPAQPELPASLDWLLEHQEEFWFAELQQPPAVDGAAGVDFADQLSGCWGMARPAGGEIPVPHWQAYKFDSHKKEFVLWIMEDPFGLRLFQIVILESGTYEVVQEGDTPAIRFVTTECWVSNPETGQLVEEHLFEGPEVGETPAVLDAGSLYLEVGGSADSVWWQGWIGVAACLAVAAVAWVATDMLICKDQQKTRDHNALIEASSAEFVGEMAPAYRHKSCWLRCLRRPDHVFGSNAQFFAPVWAVLTVTGKYASPTFSGSSPATRHRTPEPCLRKSTHRFCGRAKF